MTLTGSASPSRLTYDTAVIGGGIAGLALGRALALAGMSVVVLERGDSGAAASGANAGTLALQNKRPPLLGFFRRATEEWHSHAEAMGFDATGYRQPGGFHVATNAEEVARLRTITATLGQAGIQVDWLEGAALRTHAPWLGRAVCAATHSRLDAYANPLLACAALANAARAAGADILHHTPVCRAARHDRRFSLSTPSCAIECKRAVIAAGPWSREAGALFGASIPVEPSLIMLSVSEPSPPALDAIVIHVGGRLTVKQVESGGILIGGGWPGRGAFDSLARGIDALMLKHNLAFAAAVVPSLARLRLLRSWVGYEARTPDGLPIMGPIDGIEGLYAAIPAAGGWTAGPFLARCAAELIVTGRMPEIALPLSPRRFGR